MCNTYHRAQYLIRDSVEKLIHNLMNSEPVKHYELNDSRLSICQEIPISVCTHCYLNVAYWDISTEVKLGCFAADISCTGEWILICLMCVSRPFWWLDKTAIWIMNDRTGLWWMSNTGIITQPFGSFKSTCSTSVRSLKWFPTLIEILKMKTKLIIIIITDMGGTPGRY